MIIAVNVAPADAERRLVKRLVAQVPGICVRDAVTLAALEIKAQLERYLAEEASEYLEGLELGLYAGMELPADLAEKAKKAAQKSDDR